jgi:hypothetical protein
MSVPIQIPSLKDDQYISLKEFTPYSTDSEESFEEQEIETQYRSNTTWERQQMYANGMLSRYTTDRIT